MIEWVQDTFTVYRKELKGIEWGPLYDAYKDQAFPLSRGSEHGPDARISRKALLDQGRNDVGR